jgi:hypothetical protein
MASTPAPRAHSGPYIPAQRDTPPLTLLDAVDTVQEAARVGQFTPDVEHAITVMVDALHRHNIQRRGLLDYLNREQAGAIHGVPAKVVPIDVVRAKVTG